MTTLQALADARDEILKAELAALLHNLGKLSSAFIGQMTSFPSGYADFSYQYITGILADWYNAQSGSLPRQDLDRVRDAANKAASPVTYDFLNQAIQSVNIRQWFQKLQIQLPYPLDDREYAFGDLIEFHRSWHKAGGSPNRISIIHGFTPLLTNIIHLAHDAASGGEKQNAQNLQQQRGEKLTKASAFGYESQVDLTNLETQRHTLLENTLFSLPNHQQVIENALKTALGDTQRPINDVTLWDLSFSTATFLKSSTAAAILTSTGYLPNDLWRLLHVSFDGLAFWSHAHHITDMLARRETLQKGLDAVRELLEVQYPLGNEIYRDEHGSVFVVADFDNLLNLTDNRGKSLKILLLEAFDGEDIKGELQPEIEVSKAYRGKEMKLAQTLERRGLTRLLDVEQITPSWSEEFRPKQAPICTVCGIRPVGYPGEDTNNTQDFAAWATQEKAMNQNICRVCLQRRGRRAKRWSNQEDTSFEQTVWIDEVADINAGVALIVGQFVLDDWLNGTLIATLQKSDSFARIQRCWETTRTFWKEIEQNIFPKDSGTQKQMRLMIRPTNAAHLQKSLANYHTYELATKGIRIGVCWDADSGLFLSTANLRYVAKLLGIERKIWQDDEKLLAMLKDEVITGNLHIYERGGYGARERKISPVAENCQVIEESVFKPFIPLATEPAMFMALVPTNRAKDVARAIKAKYDKEMARVRDRLPIHLGIIFASRRTTVQTMLDAGRKMLTMPGQWEPWKVYPSPSSQRHIRFEQGSRSFFWEYPAYMGDGSTTDIWYSHLLTTDPSTDEINVVPVDQLQSGQTVYIRPSRFDFEFLDTTDRRFDIAYDQHGRRPARATRPYLLDDLDRFDVIWRVMKQLKPAQRYQVIQMIETTRELWYGNDRGGISQQDEVFRQFVSDTLAGASWPEGRQWKQLKHEEQQVLMQAGVRGELADLLELHHAILKEEEEQPANEHV